MQLDARSRILTGGRSHPSPTIPVSPEMRGRGGVKGGHRTLAMLSDGRSLSYMQPHGATFRTEIGLNDAKAKKFNSSELLLPLEQVVPGLGRPMSLRNRVKRVEKKVRPETEIVKR